PSTSRTHLYPIHHIHNLHRSRASRDLHSFPTRRSSDLPRMQAAQPVSHSSQKMPESPGTSAKTNPSPPQTNSPTTILVFHFFPMTGLSLMRLGAGRARLLVSGCDRSVTP